MRGANLNGVDTSTHANASLDAMQKGVELISLPLQVATPVGAGLGFLYEVNQGNYVSAGASVGTSGVLNLVPGIPGALSRGAGLTVGELVK